MMEKSLFDNKSHKDAWTELMRLSDESDVPIPCTNHPEAFHPAKGKSLAEARSLCNECPIKSACAEYGILYEEDGVYGGLAAGKRRQIRRLRGLKPLATQYVAEPDQGAVDTLLGTDLAHAGEFTNLFEG
jgi:Transcription factor WhiB